MPAVPRLKPVLLTVAVASVAWWTTLLGYRLLVGFAPAAAALLLAAGAGYGLVALLLRRAVGPATGLLAERAAQAPTTRWTRVASVLGVALLLPVGLLGAAIQAGVRAALGGAPGPSAFEWPDRLLLGAGGTVSAGAVLALVILVPVLEELLYRGVLLPALMRHASPMVSAVLVTLASGVTLTGGRAGAADWIAVLVAALVWSAAATLARMATGSVAASVIVRIAVAAAWAISASFTSGAPRATRHWIGSVAAASCLAGGALLVAVLRAGRESAVTSAAAGTPRAKSSLDSRPRWVLPVAGAVTGAGVLVAETLVVVRGLLETWGGAGVGSDLAAALALHVTGGAALDLAAQAVLPRRLRGHPAMRSAVVLLAAFPFIRCFGLFASAAWLVVPVAAAFAAACCWSWARPLPAAMALLAAALGLPAPRLAPVSAAGGGAAAPPAGSPSLVLVVLDTVRRDHVSAYGHVPATTPHFDALAARGVRFDQAYATSCWSVPSHASLFTGLLPRHHGAGFEQPRLLDGFPTLASALAAGGYETAGFSANPYVTAATGFARGFSTFEESWRPYVMRRALAALRLVSLVERRPPGKGGEDVVAGVRRFVARRDPARPYFLFVNFMEAHAPYQDAALARRFLLPGTSQARAESLGRESHDAQWLGTRVPPGDLPDTLRLMDGAVASADARLGEILDAVGSSAVVAIVSDHGDLVGEHELFGHMTSLHEPLLRVPFALAGPGVPAGRVVEGPVSLVDVMPTFLELAGFHAPPADGESLAPVVAAGDVDPTRPLLAEHDRNDALALWAPTWPASRIAALRARKAAVIATGLKRVVAEDGADLGYDLRSDPGEERPFPGDATGLAVTLELPGAAPRPAVLSREQLEALRSLGYVH